MSDDDTWDGGEPPSDDRRPPRLLGERFELLEVVDQRGATTLYRALDRDLQTPVAVKVIPHAHAGAPPEALLARFDEKPVETRFQHPYLVRLLARGRYAQGIWLAMDWVAGGTLRDLLERCHGRDDPDRYTVSLGEVSGAGIGAAINSASGLGAPAADGSRLAMLRMLHLLSEAAFGLGEAHRQGLVHLDLKPDNIMYEERDAPPRAIRPVEWRAWFGDESEAAARVLVPRLIDWGLSRRVEVNDREVNDREASDREAHDPDAHDGQVPGVPAYLAPERAAGLAVQATADVYALGAILYHVLTGHRPFGRRSREEVLASLRNGVRPDPPKAPEDFVEFCEVCLRAMHPDPRQRHSDGIAFGLALRRARAAGRLRKAANLRTQTDALRKRARAMRSAAHAALDQIEQGHIDRIEQCHQPWALQDRASELDDEANIREAQWVEAVRAVLTIDPELPEGIISLIDWHSAQLLAAEGRGERNTRLAYANLEAAMRQLDDLGAIEGTKTLEGNHSDKRGREITDRARRLLAGAASISLATLPEATISVTRLVMKHRRLEIASPGFEVIGTGRLVRHAMPFGRLLLRLEAEGHHPVLLPVHLHRGEDWSTTPPQGSELLAIPLPPLGTLRAGEVYIAPGWCWIGGERHACDSPEGRPVWIDGFVMLVNPITHREWLDFLNALVAAGAIEEAAARVPTPSDLKRPLSLPAYVFVEGRYQLARSDDEPSIEEMLDWPVSCISWHDADAYARWRAETDGVAWRLPCEWEYEKAARCNDERRLPWGDHLEPVWTRVGGSTAEMYQLAPVHAPTGDVTAHGLRWMVGNMPTWCLDPWSFEGPPAYARLVIEDVIATATGDLRMLRGCAYFTPPSFVSGANRFAYASKRRATSSGVRLVRSWPR